MLLVLLPLASLSALSFPDKYDKDIEQAAKRYLPGIDWRLLKAQYYQESRLDPDAVSPVGARGIAQFMPKTWADISRQLGYGIIPPTLAEPAIEAGAYYMGQLRRAWKAPRPEKDRHSLALASYNAGMGNILKAQKLAKNVDLYEPIIAELYRVTGKYSKETITYVKRIWEYWTMMMLRVSL